MEKSKFTKITISTTVHAPLKLVYEVWNAPQHVMQWNHASEDWHCPSATNDLRVDGKFVYRMAAKDASFEFDFVGTYTVVTPEDTISYVMEDGREVTTVFQSIDAGTKVTTVFDAENENSLEMQLAGWQAILNNFRDHVEKLLR